MNGAREAQAANTQKTYKTLKRRRTELSRDSTSSNTLAKKEVLSFFGLQTLAEGLAAQRTSI